MENSTVDRTVELIQSKKKLVLLVEKKALQQVMVRFSSLLDCHVNLEKRNERLQQYMNEITYSYFLKAGKTKRTTTIKQKGYHQVRVFGADQKKRGLWGRDSLFEWTLPLIKASVVPGGGGGLEKI